MRSRGVQDRLQQQDADAEHGGRERCAENGDAAAPRRLATGAGGGPGPPVDGREGGRLGAGAGSRVVFHVKHGSARHGVGCFT